MGVNSVMKGKAVLAVTVVLALALAAVAMAAPAPYKVTGGGQTFASGDIGSDGKPTVKGPGDTITFQASIANQGQDDNATGSVNIIDRSGGTGHFKGTVECAYLVSSDDGGECQCQDRGDRENCLAPHDFVTPRGLE